MLSENTADSRPPERRASLSTQPTTEPRLRLLLVVGGPYPPDYSGSMLRVHRTLRRLIRAHPLDVKVLAFAGPSTAPGLSMADDVRVLRTSPSLNAFQCLAVARENLLSKADDRPDLIYGSGAGRLVYATCGLARFLKIPYVFELTNNNIDAFIHNRATGFIARKAGKIFALSEPLRQQFIHLGVPADRIWLRPNPVETDRFRMPTPSERAEARKELAISGGDIMHLIVGALVDRKNQMLALDAIERLPEKHRLMIVGPAMPNKPHYAATLKRRVGASPASGRISLVSEFISDITALMWASDCLWLPSKEEGLPNVMLEALCSGVPCIINRDLGFDQHVFDLVNGFRAAPQVDSWVAAVHSIGPLIVDHERRRSISEQARRLYDSANTDGQLWRHLCEVACGRI